MNACEIHSSHFRAKEPIHDDVMIDIANKQKSVTERLHRGLFIPESSISILEREKQVKCKIKMSTKNLPAEYQTVI